MVDKLTENIASWADEGYFQAQDVIAQYGLRKGMIVFDWSVTGQIAIEGTDELAVGTYKMKVADNRNAIEGDGTAMATRNVALPDNAILAAVPIIDVHEAKAGSGTLNVNIGTVKVTSDAALTSVGTYVDDGVGNVLVAGRKSAAEEDISVVVTSDTLTAGGFTLFVEYWLGG